jgi:uncharacterized protein (DUF305 family)
VKRTNLTVAALLGLLAVVVVASVVVLLRAGHAQDEGPKPSPVDIGFAQDMAVHHDQAVLMAGIARDRGSAPVRGIAAAIEDGQAAEAGMLRGWLTLWGQPTLPTGEPMSWMPAGRHHAMGGSVKAQSDAMPGMATMLQIDALRTRTGPAFDAEFARLMIRHHEGGILMAQQAVRRAALSTTRDFATLVIVAQTQEIAELRALAPVTAVQ